MYALRNDSLPEMRSATQVPGRSAIDLRLPLNLCDRIPKKKGGRPQPAYTPKHSINWYNHRRLESTFCNSRASPERANRVVLTKPRKPAAQFHESSQRSEENPSHFGRKHSSCTSVGHEPVPPVSGKRDDVITVVDMLDQGSFETIALREGSYKPIKPRKASLDFPAVLRCDETHHPALDKYAKGGSGVEIHGSTAEIGKVFVQFLNDLDQILPGDREALSYMKELAGTLQQQTGGGGSNRTSDHPNYIYIGAAELGSESQEPKAPARKATQDRAKRYGCEDMRYTDSRPSNPAIRFLAAHKKVASVPCFEYMMKSSGSNNSVNSNKTPSNATAKVEEKEKDMSKDKKPGRNPGIDRQHVGSFQMVKAHSGKVSIPKLQLKNVRMASQEFNEEFLEKMDEFSESWRQEAEAMRTVKKQGSGQG